MLPYKPHQDENKPFYGQIHLNCTVGKNIPSVFVQVCNYEISWVLYAENIHPSIYPFIFYHLTPGGVLEPILVDIGRRQGIPWIIHQLMQRSDKNSYSNNML